MDYLEDALDSVQVGTNSAIKANPLGIGVWNDFQEKLGSWNKLVFK